MQNDSTAEKSRNGMSRRTVVKGAAWSLPVIAAAVATPLASASSQPPTANFAAVRAIANPTPGSNPNFSAEGQLKSGEDYADGAELPAGTPLTITFANGATATSITNLVGLTYVSGDPATGGPVFFQVTAATAGRVSLKLNNVQPAGGTINAEILGGIGTSTITSV